MKIETLSRDPRLIGSASRANNRLKRPAVCAIRALAPIMHPTNLVYEKLDKDLTDSSTEMVKRSMILNSLVRGSVGNVSRSMVRNQEDPGTNPKEPDRLGMFVTPTA